MEMPSDKMRVIVDLDLSLQGYDQLSQIMDGYAEILKNDTAATQIICSEATKQAISKSISSLEEYKFNEELCGAKYVNNEAVKFSRIIIVGFHHREGIYR